MKHAVGTRHRVLIPGKTFLVGEYLALAGGPSVVVNTAPHFEFSWISETASSSARLIRHPFHVDSPAGKWLDQISISEFVDASLAHEIQFSDPFKGRGGMGASTAEFAGAWVFRRWLRDLAAWDFDASIVSSLEDHRQRIAPTWKSERIGSMRFRDLLDDYRQAALVGSGADLVSQVAGGVAVWDARIDEMRRFAWPFEELAMTLVLTGNKISTHTHLTGLAPLGQSVQAEMLEWVEEAVQSFALSDADRLVASVRGFGKVLVENGRLAEHSKALLDHLADISGVRAAKGCGAMGSDVLLILHDRSAGVQVAEFCDSNGLKRAGNDTDVSSFRLETEAICAEASL